MGRQQRSRETSRAGDKDRKGRETQTWGGAGERERELRGKEEEARVDQRRGRDEREREERVQERD